MGPLRNTLSDAALSGSLASAFSTVAVALLGKAEHGNAAMLLNAPSQWLWGEQAAYYPRADARHTLAGLGIHHLSAIFWGLIHEATFSGKWHGHTRAQWLAQGACTAALASFVDYQLTPRRLRPGYEKHLGRGALFWVYAATALGFAAPRFVRGRAQS